MKFAVAPGWPGPKSAEVPPWTISTRSTVSSIRNIELLSMKDRLGEPYTGVPWTMVVKYGESPPPDRKSTRLNSSHSQISYAVFCLIQQTANSPHSPTFSPDKQILNDLQGAPLISATNQWLLWRMPLGNKCVASTTARSCDISMIRL